MDDYLNNITSYDESHKAQIATEDEYTDDNTPENIINNIAAENGVTDVLVDKVLMTSLSDENTFSNKDDIVMIEYAYDKSVKFKQYKLSK